MAHLKMGRKKTFLVVTAVLSAVIGANIYYNSWKADKAYEDEELLKQARTISIEKDGNSLEWSTKEHRDFLKEMGIPVTEELFREGTATYTVDRTGFNFRGKIHVEFNGREIGVFHRSNLEHYIEKNRKNR